MAPRAVDWSLAFVVWALFATGVLSLYVARESEAWVFVAHGVLGFALVVLLVWKLRRVLARLLDPDGRTWFAVGALVTVGAALVSGFVWSAGGEVIVWGYNLMGWHMVLGSALVVAVLFHAIVPEAAAPA